MQKRKFDPARFKELILYVCQLGAEDERLGAVKLNKLLFYADKEAFLRRGQTISGARYVHMPEGPVPIALVPNREQLIEAGRLRPDKRPSGMEQPLTRLEATDAPRLQNFDPEELAIVREVVRRYWYLNGTDLSRLSHFEAGWLVTTDKQDIPERSFWLSGAPLDDDQIALGQRLWAGRA
jgi:uncharacterized phage-associated protein